MVCPLSVSTDDPNRHALQWLSGVALVDTSTTLPTMACASKSALRSVAAGPGARDDAGLVAMIPRGRPGLRLIFNDDHGMTPSVTIVNQTSEKVVLRALRPAVLATDNGTYDLDALLAGAPRTIEPGHPLVIRITDIGRNVGEAFRVGTAERTSDGHGSRADTGAAPDGGDDGMYCLGR